MGDAGRETGDAKTMLLRSSRSIVRRSRTRFCVSRLPSSISPPRNNKAGTMAGFAITD
jgi:hypothetical protein